MLLIRVFQIALRSVGGITLVEGKLGFVLESTFTKGGLFSAGEHLRRSAFDHLNHFQIKTTSFWKYRTSTCVYKEYKVKVKMVQEQWLQLKMKFLLVYYMKMFIEWEGN